MVGKVQWRNQILSTVVGVWSCRFVSRGQEAETGSWSVILRASPMSLFPPARPPVRKSATFPNGSASQTLSVQTHKPEGPSSRSKLSPWKSARLSISLHSGWTETEHSQICIKREQRDSSMVKMAQLPAFSEYLGFLPRNLAGWLTTSHTFSSGGCKILF